MDMQMPPQGPPLGLSTRGAVAAIVSVVCWFVAVIFVLLRFLSRRAPLQPGMDDWMALASLFPTLGLVISTVFWAIKGGLGWHTNLLPMDQMQTGLKCFFAVMVMYPIACPMIKVAVLLLYKRIFAVPKFCCVIYFFMAVSIGYGVSFLFALIFQCTPVAGFWNPMIAEHCVDAEAVFLGNTIAALLTDVMILCLPIPMILRLQISTKRKWAVLGMFSLGAFVCVTSLFRITSVLGSDRMDFSYTDTYAMMWSCVELSIGIVCACLPTLGPFIRQTAHKLNSSMRLGRSTPSTEPYSNGGYADLESPVRTQRSGKKDQILLDTLDRGSKTRTPPDEESLAFARQDRLYATV